MSAFEQPFEEGNTLFTEYYVQRKIQMIETKGFYVNDEGLLDELLQIMSGR